MTKKLSCYALLILMLIGSSFPVQAASNQVLTIKLYTDPGIEWEKGDYLTITCKNSNTGDNVNMKLDLTKITDSGLEKDITAGTYQISDISYEGGNSKVEQIGYAITSSFVVAENEGAYNEIRIAAGYDEVEKLTMMYSEVMIKQNGALVNELTETSNADNTDGEIIQSNESQQTTVEQQKGNEKQIKESPQKVEADSAVTRENQVLKIIPLFFFTGVIAIVIFVVHKKGMI